MGGGNDRDEGDEWDEWDDLDEGSSGTNWMNGQWWMIMLGDFQADAPLCEKLTRMMFDKCLPRGSYRWIFISSQVDD